MNFLFIYSFLFVVICGNALGLFEAKKSDDDLKSSLTLGSLVGKTFNDAILKDEKLLNTESKDLQNTIIAHDTLAQRKRLAAKKNRGRKPVQGKQLQQNAKRPAQKNKNTRQLGRRPVPGKKTRPMRGQGNRGSTSTLEQQLRQQIADLEFQIQLAEINAEEELEQERRNRHLNEIQRRELRAARFNQMRANRRENTRLRRAQLEATVAEIIELAREEERELLEEEYRLATATP
uniref:BZIP domain-containing protein n=1 Tax=Strongyloides stercoralis TaxID=6248 RepID=A0A0K0ELC3_STRER